jgi:hypothetical protein
MLDLFVAPESRANIVPLPDLPPIPDGPPAAVAVELLATVAGPRARAEVMAQIETLERQADSQMRRIVDCYDSRLVSIVRHGVIGLADVLKRRRTYLARLKALGGDPPAEIEQTVGQEILTALLAARPEVREALDTIRRREAERLSEAEETIRRLLSTACTVRSVIGGCHQDGLLELLAAALTARSRALRAAEIDPDPDRTALAVIESLIGV